MNFSNGRNPLWYIGKKGQPMRDDEAIVSNDIINTAKSLFETIRHSKNDVEYWEARELAVAIGYARWENFENVVRKAIVSLKNSGGLVDNHFREVTKMVDIGSDTVRPTRDYILSRYACYLISQNGDPRKNEIALAQAYFAQQTRRQEEHDKSQAEIERVVAREKLTNSDKYLSSVVLDRNVDRKGLAKIKSEGDQRLFGGNSTGAMKRKYKISTKQPLAYYLPTISLNAKQLANEMTSLNTVEKDLSGLGQINTEHNKNNDAIRRSLTERKIYLENLPPEEDIKKVKRRLTKKKKDLLN